jgi:hypothetical protein
MELCFRSSDRNWILDRVGDHAGRSVYERENVQLKS